MYLNSQEQKSNSILEQVKWIQIHQHPNVNPRNYQETDFPSEKISSRQSISQVLLTFHILDTKDELLQGKIPAHKSRLSKYSFSNLTKLCNEAQLWKLFLEEKGWKSSLSEQLVGILFLNQNNFFHEVKILER
jgi:hypothetical protein